MITSHAQSSSSRDLFRNYFNARIISGPPVYVRKQFCYIGHATTTYSAEHAASVIGHISDRTRCEHALPFAISMIEGKVSLQRRAQEQYMLYVQVIEEASLT